MAASRVASSKLLFTDRAQLWIIAIYPYDACHILATETTQIELRRCLRHPAPESAPRRAPLRRDWRGSQRGVVAVLTRTCRAHAHGDHVSVPWCSPVPGLRCVRGGRLSCRCTDTSIPVPGTNKKLFEHKPCVASDCRTHKIIWLAATVWLDRMMSALVCFAPCFKPRSQCLQAHRQVASLVEMFSGSVGPDLRYADNLAVRKGPCRIGAVCALPCFAMRDGMCPATQWSHQHTATFVDRQHEKYRAVYFRQSMHKSRICLLQCLHLGFKWAAFGLLALCAPACRRRRRKLSEQ